MQVKEKESIAFKIGITSHQVERWFLRGFKPVNFTLEEFKNYKREWGLKNIKAGRPKKVS